MWKVGKEFPKLFFVGRRYWIFTYLVKYSRCAALNLLFLFRYNTLLPVANLSQRSDFNIYCWEGSLAVKLEDCGAG